MRDTGELRTDGELELEFGDAWARATTEAGEETPK